MNERTLSSGTTFWMKFVFPTFWISGLAAGTLVLFLGEFHDVSNATPLVGVVWQVLAIGVIDSVFIWFIWWSCGRLKKVRIDGSAIYVSNYFKEFRIPLDAIQDVYENPWINIHPVRVHFRYATPFGSRIIFMPTLRVFNWRSHPVVNELRELAHVQND